MYGRRDKHHPRRIDNEVEVKSATGPGRERSSTCTGEKCLKSNWASGCPLLVVRKVSSKHLDHRQGGSASHSMDSHSNCAVHMLRATTNSKG
eukprot:788779-Amphidinium_carterae.2